MRAVVNQLHSVFTPPIIWWLTYGKRLQPRQWPAWCESAMQLQITSPKVKRVVGNALELSQNLRSGIIKSGNIAGGNLSIILCNQLSYYVTSLLSLKGYVFIALLNSAAYLGVSIVAKRTTNKQTKRQITKLPF